jgi:hypothetical protein
LVVLLLTAGCVDDGPPSSLFSCDGFCFNLPDLARSSTGCQPQCGGLACGVDPVCGALCGLCPSGQVCNQGACSTVLPAPCPSSGCPHQSYCDLAANKCVAGCLDDSACDTGAICTNRQCVAGCRSDPGCGTGQICTNQKCVSGCRSDTGCAAGQICQSQKCVTGCRTDGACGGTGNICDNAMCRAGCRDNTGCASGFVCDPTNSCAAICTGGSCGTNQWCDATGTKLCTACPPDAEEPNNSFAAAKQLMFTEGGAPGSWTLSLCLAPSPDDDYLIIVPVGHTLTDHGSVTVGLTVTQADAAATITLENLAVGTGNATATQTLHGTGQLVIGTEGGAACSATTCPPATYPIRIFTDSPKPVVYTINGTFGP